MRGLALVSEKDSANPKLEYGDARSLSNRMPIGWSLSPDYVMA
jgi:hypothetical protein